jgi:hypothetical protein
MNKYMVRTSAKDPDDQFVEVYAEHHENEGGDLVFYSGDGPTHRFSERAWIYVTEAGGQLAEELRRRAALPDEDEEDPLDDS